MEDKDAAAKTLAEITDMDAEEIKEMITQDKSLVKIAKYLDSGAAEAIRKAEMPGVSLTEESKRSYPLLLHSRSEPNQSVIKVTPVYDGTPKSNLDNPIICSIRIDHVGRPAGDCYNNGKVSVF